MTPVLNVELAAEPASAARSRRATSEWLMSLCGLVALCDAGEDIVLAVNEAVSNGIEHAYPGGGGIVTVYGEVRMTGPREPYQPGCADLEIRIEVTDHGSWRVPSPDPGYRGRGLLMAEAAVDRIAVAPGPHGTVVTLQRTLGCSSRLHTRPG